MTKIISEAGKEYELLIEVDGESLDFTGLLMDSHVGGYIGAVFGSDADVPSSDEVIGWTVTESVWFLAVERNRKGENYWGQHAIYKRGEWDKGENGEVIYRVWDRLI